MVVRELIPLSLLKSVAVVLPSVKLPLQPPQLQYQLQFQPQLQPLRRKRRPAGGVK